MAKARRILVLLVLLGMAVVPAAAATLQIDDLIVGYDISGHGYVDVYGAGLATSAKFTMDLGAGQTPTSLVQQPTTGNIVVGTTRNSGANGTLWLRNPDLTANDSEPGFAAVNAVAVQSDGTVVASDVEGGYGYVWRLNGTTLNIINYDYGYGVVSDLAVQSDNAVGVSCESGGALYLRTSTLGNKAYITNAALDLISPFTNSISFKNGFIFSILPVIKLSSTLTFCLRFTNSSTIFEPMNPAPPVTKY